MHDYKVHRKTNPDTLDETLPKHDQQGQANIYADVIKWGKANGMAGIRYWAPDYEGWYAMSMFDFSNKKGTAKTILRNHKTIVE